MSGIGEANHERCRHGYLQGAVMVSDNGETPIILPMCGWQLPANVPTPVRRLWGGNAVSPECDCSTCPAFSPL